MEPWRVSVLLDPITPPIAAVATSSTISTSAGSSRRSTSSRVVIVSPARANRTAKPPVIRLRSWACMGWPNSSIT